MSTESFSIKFMGKNYEAWKFQFKMFRKRKELWDHIDTSSSTPEKGKELNQWKMKDVQIIS